MALIFSSAPVEHFHEFSLNTCHPKAWHLRSMHRTSTDPNPFSFSVPLTQLQLNETEMKEEVTRVLTANDPHVPNNITKYNFKERTYKVDPPGQGDLLAIHFSYDGCALHKVPFIFP